MSSRKILVTLAAIGLLISGAFVGVNAFADGQNTHEVQISGDSSAKVYSSEQLTDEQVAQIDASAAADAGPPVSTGDLAFCQMAVEQGVNNPICASMVLAYANGDLDPRPGDRTMHFVAQCGEKPLPGELDGCGRITSEDIEADDLSNTADGR